MKRTLSISITRPTNYYKGDEECVNLRLECEHSHVEFVDAKIPLTTFMKALTGQVGLRFEAEIRGLDKVGKNRESKPLSFDMPETGSYKDQKKTAEELAQKYADEGWIADRYFGSQKSFSYNQETGVKTAHTRQLRWVEVEE